MSLSGTLHKVSLTVHHLLCLPCSRCARVCIVKPPLCAGYVAPGDTYKDAVMLQMQVVSLLHSDSEYGGEVDPATGRHHGGPFSIMVSPQMRVEELRLIIRVSHWSVFDALCNILRCNTEPSPCQRKDRLRPHARRKLFDYRC